MGRPNCLIIVEDVSNNEIISDLLKYFTDLFISNKKLEENNVKEIKNEQNNLLIGKNHGTIHIDNKYYHVDIDLISVQTISSEISFILQETEALFISFNPMQSNTIDLLNNYEDYLIKNDFNPELKLLLCNCLPQSHTENGGTLSTDETLSRDAIFQWAVKYHYEIVEMNPHPDDVEEDECFGLDRIKSALHSNTWSTMNIKNDSSALNGNLTDSEEEEEKEDDNKTAKIKIDEKQSSTKEDKSGHVVVAAAGGGEDNGFNAGGSGGSHKPTSPIVPPIENEEDKIDFLFQRFSDLKTQAQDLSFDERKKFAEKVTLEFWKAIGGSDDEIDDLSD